MIEFIADNKPKITFTMDGHIEITFTASRSYLKSFDGLKDKALTVTVKEFRPKRSLSQNAYLWVMLDKLAQKLSVSKELLYRNYVRDYGIFEILPLKNEAVVSFKLKWGKNGLGWFCEDLGESKLKGYTKLMAYYGSSTYNTQEMTRLIDAVVMDCKELGIDTMSLSDIMLLQNDNDT